MAQQAVIDLLANVAQICRQAPTPTLIAAYVRAARELCLGSRWLVVSITGETVADQQSYSLGGDTYAEIFGLAGITLYKSASDPRPLDESDSALWDPTQPTACPELYQYQPEAQFSLHPTPDAVYDMTIGAVIAPKVGSTSIDDRLVTKWRTAMEDGALAYLRAMPDVPWFNERRAEKHEFEFRRAISQAANIASLGFNAGATPLRSIALEST